MPKHHNLDTIKQFGTQKQHRNHKASQISSKRTDLISCLRELRDVSATFRPSLSNETTTSITTRTSLHVCICMTCHEYDFINHHIPFNH